MMLGVFTREITVKIKETEVDYQVEKNTPVSLIGNRLFVVQYGYWVEIEASPVFMWDHLMESTIRLIADLK